MPRRHSLDQAGLQRVLVLGGVLVGLCGLGMTAWGLVEDGWGLVAGPGRRRGRPRGGRAVRAVRDRT